MNPRTRSLANNQVHAKIFHRGIQYFLDGGLQAVDFIQKENFLFFERREDRCQITFALQQRSGAGLDRYV